MLLHSPFTRIFLKFARKSYKAQYFDFHKQNPHYMNSGFCHSCISMISIYTKEHCPYCIRAKALLDELNAEYTETIIDKASPEFTELSAKTGMSTVPQIFIDDECIGGCDDLFAMHKAGELIKKIGKE